MAEGRPARGHMCKLSGSFRPQKCSTLFVVRPQNIEMAKCHTVPARSTKPRSTKPFPWCNARHAGVQRGGEIPRPSVVRACKRGMCVCLLLFWGGRGGTCSFTSSWSWTHLGATTVPPCISTMIAARRENPPPEGMKNCNQYIVQVCVTRVAVVWCKREATIRSGL
jgi:hypothetical protein